MRWLEWALAAFVALGAVIQLFATPRVRAWPYALSTGAVLAVQLWMIGPHWQVWPIYLAAAFSAAGAYVPGMRRSMAWLSLGLASLGAVCCSVLPMFDLPRPTGPYAVGVRSEIVEDPSRGVAGAEIASGVEGTGRRRLPLRIWYPAVAGTGRERGRYTTPREVKWLWKYKAQIRTNAVVAAEPVPGKTFPVIVFGPRWGGARVQDTFLTEELASEGYVVVAVDHPGNAALADTDGVVVKGSSGGAVTVGPGSSAASLEAAWATELRVWTADDEAVLRELAARSQLAARSGGDKFFAELDLDRVGALGHSFGGASAMALLGVDARVRCAVNLDGWTFGGMERRTREPVLIVYEDVGDGKLPAVDPKRREAVVEAELDRDDLAAVERSLTRYGGVRASIAGTQHLDFTDQTLISPVQRLTFTGPLAGRRVREIVRGLVVGFFDQTLKAKRTLPGYAEVKMERFPVPEK